MFLGYMFLAASFFVLTLVLVNFSEKLRGNGS